MRVKNSLLNISAGIGHQFIITALGFASRTVFLNTLGIEYLGINGLFTNILAILSLVEAGIGSSIVFNLYKPVAENDQTKINMLMNIYKKAYAGIALIVLALGLAIMPFLGFIVKNSSVQHIYLIYGIFLLNTVSPYLYVHKSSFLNVCQKAYISTLLYSASSILTTLFKIGILYFTHNYILYLMIDSLISISTSFVLSVTVNRIYPYLKNKATSKLDEATKHTITKNIKAIVFQNIGTYLVFGTDNIIISSFVSLAAVGLYSNYNMLIETARAFINQIFNNVYHSVGNLVAKESKDKVYHIYKVYRLINFWLYSIFTIVLYSILEPFISLWIGTKFIMGKSVLLVLILIFYEQGMRNSITTVKTTAGIFHEDRYATVFQAVINLAFSIMLVEKMGIVGVFYGTLISALAVPFWRTPYLVYRKVFHLSVIHYFRTYALFLSIGTGTYFITSCINDLFRPDDLNKLLMRGAICLIIPNIIYLCLFYKTEEFSYIKGIVLNLAGLVVQRSRFVNKKLPSS